MTEQQMIKPKQGIILISEPSLKDFYFRQSVVLLAEHNEEGTFGVIVNKPINTRLDEVIKGFRGYDFPVYLGGPVKNDCIFFIHSHPDIEDSLRIIDGLYWGGSLDAIQTLIEAGKITENDIRFYLGYSGWNPNQLDREISEKSWVLSHASIQEVINPNPEELWSNYLKNMGTDYAIWANFPADPALN